MIFYYALATVKPQSFSNDALIRAVLDVVSVRACTDLHVRRGARPVNGYCTVLSSVVPSVDTVQCSLVRSRQWGVYGALWCCPVSGDCAVLSGVVPSVGTVRCFLVWSR